jgi:hypothetical protein
MRNLNRAGCALGKSEGEPSSLKTTLKTGCGIYPSSRARHHELRRFKLARHPCGAQRRRADCSWSAPGSTDQVILNDFFAEVLTKEVPMLYSMANTNTTTSTITGHDIARGRKSKSQKAAIAAMIILGELNLDNPTKNQIAKLVGVSVSSVGKALSLDVADREAMAQGQRCLGDDQ